MTNKKLFLLYSWLVLILTVSAIFLMIFSWVGALYNLNVQSLLSVDGMRWLLRYSLRDTQAVFPFLQLLSLAMGVGVIYYSGWLTTGIKLLKSQKNQLSYKQVWAFRVSSIIGMLFFLLIAWDLFSGDSVMLSVSGTLKDSPFVDGFSLWFSIICIIIGAIHGFLTGVYKKFHEFARSMVYAVQSIIPILILIYIFFHFSLMVEYVFFL